MAAALVTVAGRGAELLLGAPPGISGHITPAHAAAAAGHALVLRLLFAARAAVGAMDACGATPLHAAAAGGHVEAAGVLIGEGAAVGAEDH